MNRPGAALELLAIEDSANDLRLLQALLGESDPRPQIHAARTLEQATRALAERSFDCVLLDLGLPDGDGVENVERIRACARDAAIVVLTGRDDRGAAVLALRRGAQEYAIKGEHDGASLIRIIQHAIERHRLLVKLDAARERAYERASHDGLTGLPNRQLLFDRAQQALSRAERTGGRVALCFLDLDDFKLVNDSHGHAVGDSLLCEVARRLRESVRDGDTVARLGGDEFAVLLAGAPERAESVRIADRMVEQIGAISEIDGREVTIGVSAGLALYPEHGDGAAQMVGLADAAMYAAKRAGKGMLRTADQQQASAGLDGGGLTLRYQPWIDLSSGRCAGIEALVRSRNADSGGAEDVLRRAEQAGSLDALGRWVLSQACFELNAMERHEPAPPRFAVNVSPAELDAADFAASRLALLDEYGIAPPRLTVEVPEEAFEHRNCPARVAQLKQLRERGVRITLDGFGRVSGSLRRLLDLPVSGVKLDLSLLHGLRGNGRAMCALVESILRFANALGLDAVVTGIETADDFRIAAALPARQVQGYWLGHPLPPADMRSPAANAGGEPRLRTSAGPA